MKYICDHANDKCGDCDSRYVHERNVLCVNGWLRTCNMLVAPFVYKDVRVRCVPAEATP